MNLILFLLLYPAMVCNFRVTKNFSEFMNERILVSTQKLKFGEVKNTNIRTPIWTPIEVNFNSNVPMLYFCQLDFKRHSEAPHESVRYMKKVFIIYTLYLHI